MTQMSIVLETMLRLFNSGHSFRRCLYAKWAGSDSCSSALQDPSASREIPQLHNERSVFRAPWVSDY